MTMEESKKILGIIAAAYQNFKPEDVDLTVKVWHGMLKEYDYRMVGEATKRYIKTDKKGFPPAPGQIIEQLNLMTKTTQMTAQEAWGLVYKAICNSNYNSVEEFNKLPDLAQQAVGTPARLREMAADPDFNMGVESSNFYRAYDTVCKRQTYNDTVGPDLQAKLSQIQQIALTGGQT